MSLVACVQCAKEISKNAESCPHCGFIVSEKARKAASEASQKIPCRACGTMLLLNEYRKPRHNFWTIWVEGTSYTKSSSNIDCLPCPQCGEPKPLMLFGDKAIHKILYFLLLVLILGIINVLGFTQIYIFFAVVCAWYWFGYSRYPSIFY